jgi:hypothetical protein
MSVTSPRAASDFHRREHLKCRVLLEAVHIEIQTIIIKMLKHDMLNVSKSVARYQKYMHIKACVTMGNAPRAWGQVKMTFVLYLGGSTILWPKGIIIIIYCPSCRKQCKNWWPVISWTKHWGMCPTSITISLHTRGVHRNRNALCDYTYTGSSGKPEVTLDISQILMELLIALHLETHCSEGSAPCWVAEKLQPHAKEIFCWGI